MSRRIRGIGVMLSGLVAVALTAGSALAASFSLDIEFDNATPGTYASVEVTENAGDLDFSIVLDPSLGSNRDLHEFYFNLIGGFTNVTVSSSDSVTTPYSLIASPIVVGGAGASFDYAVNFGNGAGPTGNGVRMSATFTISADQTLAINDLLEESTTADGDVVVHVAAHVQGTSLVPEVDSETVGGQVPEPGTGLLVIAGLLGLVAWRRGRA